MILNRVVFGGSRWSLVQRRFATTLKDQDGDIDQELISLIKLYPSKTNPTPYELLNVQHHSFDDVVLKNNFQKFAKLYHPDIKISHPLLVNRSERFQKILHAYKLLKDPKKKMTYDEYKIGWTTDLVAANPYATSGYNSFRLSPNFKEYQYYSAGTWEDFQHMRNGSPDPSLDLAKNKYQILFGIVAVMIILGVIESMKLKEMSELERVRRLNISVRSNQDLQKLYDNYGMGQDKNARINRFLWWRQISEILFNHS